jgi:hypothetical protein
VIGNRTIQVRRAAESSVRDAEGRRVAGAVSTVATVSGHLFDRTMTHVNNDGQLLTVRDAKALLPAGTDVREQDLLVADGATYRVQTAAFRYGPSGRVEHISCQCVREG